MVLVEFGDGTESDVWCTSLEVPVTLSLFLNEIIAGNIFIGL